MLDTSIPIYLEIEPGSLLRPLLAMLISKLFTNWADQLLRHHHEITPIILV